MLSINNKIYDISGEWRFKLGAYIPFSDKCKLVSDETVIFPGTLDENKKGTINTCQDQERLSRYYTYTGPACFQKDIMIEEAWKDKDIQIFLERSRATRVYVNQEEVLHRETSSILPIPQIYSITDYVKYGQENTITIVVDNSYPDMPAEAILRSSMATDETQTNWNGILGRMELQVLDKVRITDIRIYPHKDLRRVRIICEVINTSDDIYTGFMLVQAKKAKQFSNQEVMDDHGEDVYIDDHNKKGIPSREILIQLPAGTSKSYEISDYDLGDEVELWSEFNPSLYTMDVFLKDSYNFDAILDLNNIPEEKEYRERYSVDFGVRSFKADKETGRLMINDVNVFLRCEANCAVFPLTGYAPMEEEAWEKLFSTYRSYGINTVRFHSWCPPKAAFVVADRMGMYLQPELSCWDHLNMFGDEIEKVYYRKEALAIMKTYGNHPSFVMFSLGNELHFSDLDFADKLLVELKDYDSSRLYSFASNGYYGNMPPSPNSDFYTAQSYLRSPLRGMYSGMRGFVNDRRPGSYINYEEGASRAIRGGNPVISFEVGQFQVFPDVLYELHQYTGVLEPRNMKILEKQLKEKGISKETAKAYINASGILSRLGYRQEIEAARRTSNMSGISLLGIQDFSGQGTALVGMMNALGDAKPYEFAEPKEFRSFFGEQVILFETDKFCWTNNEIFHGNVLISNYGVGPLIGSLIYRFEDRDGMVLAEGSLSHNCYDNGQLSLAGTIEVSLDKINKPTEFKLRLIFDQGSNSKQEISTSYDIWVYPVATDEDPVDIYITGELEQKAIGILQQGGKVFFSPQASKDSIPNSVVGTFTTSFWSSMFKSETQPGTMGLLMDPKHPIFNSFPTDYHTNYQWWPMTKLGRAMVLDHIQPIIQVVDGFLTLRNMGLLYEVKLGQGKLMVSSMGLEELKDQYPEARALRNSILKYMKSNEFNPEQEIKIEQLKK